MKRFTSVDTSVLKQHYEKKVHELEHEKRALQVGFLLVIFTWASHYSQLFSQLAERDRATEAQSFEYFIELWRKCSKAEAGLSSKVKCPWSTGELSWCFLITSWLLVNLHLVCSSYQITGSKIISTLQVAELKKKQDAQAQLQRQKQKSDEAAKRLQDDIQRIKTQKVPIHGI